MRPLPIPQKLIDQGVGVPQIFKAPEGLEDEVGELQMLNLTHPAQLHALLKGEPLPFEPGSKDLWVCWWEPTTQEKNMIYKGAPIRLTFIGLTELNPMVMNVGHALNNNIEFDGGNN